MTPITQLFGLGLFLVLMFLLLLILKKTSPQSAMLERVAQETRAARRPPRSSEAPQSSPYVEWLAKPFGLFRGLFATQSNSNVVRRLSLAGYRQPAHADLFLGARLAVPVVLGVLVSLYVQESVIFFFLVSLVIGYFVPDFWLAQAINRRRQRISDSLPNGLDLLSICLEAGLGLDQAIVRVGQELRLVSPQLSQELLQINFEQRAGVPRIESWKAFSNRTNLDDLKQFVAMLVQTERFGTPIAVALNTFSQSLRLQRAQKAEERGAKAAVKMIIPMAFFIFPMVFIVTVGPAVVGLIRNLLPLLE